MLVLLANSVESLHRTFYDYLGEIKNSMCDVRIETSWKKIRQQKIINKFIRAIY